MKDGTTTVLLALIALVGTLATLVVSVLNNRTGRRNESKIDDVKKQTDGLTKAQVASEARASKAEGQLKGAKDEAAKQVVKDDKAAKTTDGDDQTLHLKNLEVGEGPAKKKRPTKRKKK